MKEKSYCVLVGTPVDGLKIYGPFTTDEVDDFTANFDAEFWVAELQPALENET